MDLLPLNFRSLWLCGLWYESLNNQQPWLITYAWKPFVLGMSFSSTLLQLCALMTNRQDSTDYRLFTSIACLILNLKLANFMLRRAKMMRLLDRFRIGSCRSRTVSEEILLSKCQRPIAIVFSFYTTIANLTLLILAISLTSLMDTNYSFQTWSLILGFAISIPLDTLLCGFILLTCAQIDLCCKRLIRSCEHDVRKSVKEFVEHHTMIRNIVEDLKEFFMVIVVPLLFFSLFAVCSRIYKYWQTGIKNWQTVPLLLYLGCMSSEVFFYCWFGTKLKLKGTAISETIYQLNWTSFTPAERKDFIFMMLSCQRDLSLSFHGFCTLTMDIHAWVLKCSYTAYNLLQFVSYK